MIVSAGMSTSGSHGPASKRSGVNGGFIGITSSACECEAILCCRIVAQRPQCSSAKGLITKRALHDHTTNPRTAVPASTRKRPGGSPSSAATTARVNIAAG